MADGDNLRPLIIKRKKVVGGGGHHGGAWKVAYADFVTAMMAFFMLMWLLNATTEQQRKGIADYFSPTIPITRVSGGGDGSFGGDSPFSEATAAQNGTGATSLRPTAGRQALGANGESDTEPSPEDSGLAELEEAVNAAVGDAIAEDVLLRHVQTRLTDEGLVVELHARPGAPLFSDDGNTPTDLLRALAAPMASLFNTVINEVAIRGHVAAEPVVVAAARSWDRSVASALTMRDLLIENDLDAGRVVRVGGSGDARPSDENPMSERNDRLEIILLREF